MPEAETVSYWLVKCFCDQIQIFAGELCNCDQARYMFAFFRPSHDITQVRRNLCNTRLAIRIKRRGELFFLPRVFSDKGHCTRQSFPRRECRATIRPQCLHITFIHRRCLDLHGECHSILAVAEMVNCVFSNPVCPDRNCSVSSRTI